MITSIKKRIDALKKDVEHGAGWITGQALLILKDTCIGNATHTREQFMVDMDQVVQALSQVKPGMVSIFNYVLQFKEEFDQAYLTSKSPDNLRKRGVAIATKLIVYHENSSKRAVRNAVRLIGKRSIIMTCSYSSDVCSTLEMAHQNGIDFKVLIAESCHGHMSYGKITRDRLDKSNIISRIIPDELIGWHVARASCILSGADAVSLQGWMINGVPSYTLAVIAARKKVPVHVVCTTTKFDVRGFLAGLRHPEPGFDMIPLELISSIMTEKGVIQQDMIYAVTSEVVWNAHAKPH